MFEIISPEHDVVRFGIVKNFVGNPKNPNPSSHPPAHQLSQAPPEYVNTASLQLVLHCQNVDIEIQLCLNLSCKPDFYLPLVFSIPQFSLDSSDSVMGAQEKISPCAAYSFRPSSTCSSALVPHLFIYRHSSPLVVAFNCPTLPGQQNRMAKEQQSRTRYGALGVGREGGMTRKTNLQCLLQPPYYLSLLANRRRAIWRPKLVIYSSCRFWWTQPWRRRLQASKPRQRLPHYSKSVGNQSLHVWNTCKNVFPSQFALFGCCITRTSGSRLADALWVIRQTNHQSADCTNDAMRSLIYLFINCFTLVCICKVIWQKNDRGDGRDVRSFFGNRSSGDMTAKISLNNKTKHSPD